MEKQLKMNQLYRDETNKKLIALEKAGDTSQIMDQLQYNSY